MKTFISISALLAFFSSLFGLFQYFFLGKVFYPTGFILLLLPISLCVYIISSKPSNDFKICKQKRILILFFLILFMFTAILTLLLNFKNLPLGLFLKSFVVSYFYMIIVIILFYFNKIEFNYSLFLNGFILLATIGLIIGIIHIAYNYPLCINGIKLIVFPDKFTIHSHILPEGLSASKSYFFATIIILILFILDKLILNLNKRKISFIILLVCVVCLIYFMYKANDRISIIILLLSIITYFFYNVKVKILYFLPILYFMFFACIVSFFMINMKSYINNNSYVNTRSLLARYFEWKNVYSDITQNAKSLLIGHGLSQGYDLQKAITNPHYANLKMYDDPKGMDLNKKMKSLNDIAKNKNSYSYEGICIDNQYLNILFQNGIFALIYYLFFMLYFLYYSIHYLVLVKDQSDSFLISLICVSSAYPTVMILENIGAIYFLIISVILLISLKNNKRITGLIIRK